MAVGTTYRPRDLAALAPRFGAAVAACRYESLTAESVRKAKLCLLDFLSCALASQELPYCREAVAVAAPAGRDERCSVIGTSRRASPADAAFANAVLGHALVRDDMHLGSVSHLGVVVLPVALALAEETSPPGDALLAAIACGYEAGGKIGRAVLDVDVAKTYRPTGIAGPVAAAATAGKLLGLDADGLANAIAIAANTVAGYNEWAATGGSEMFFQVGFAARNGLTAAQLAAAGAAASASALDGDAGLLAAFGKRCAASVPFDGGDELGAVFFKPVPACNYAQTPAQAAQRIARDARLVPADIEQVLVRVTHAAAAYPGCAAAGPFERVLQAKMSIPYNVAVALAAGEFDEAYYRPGEQSEIARLAQIVRLEVDPALSAAYPARQGAEVVVTLKGGAVHAARLDDVVPPSDDDVTRRFETASARQLGDGAARRLLDAVMRLEHERDAGRLARLASIAA